MLPLTFAVLVLAGNELTTELLSVRVAPANHEAPRAPPFDPENPQGDPEELLAYWSRRVNTMGESLPESIRADVAVEEVHCAGKREGGEVWIPAPERPFEVVLRKGQVVER